MDTEEIARKIASQNVLFKNMVAADIKSRKGSTLAQRDDFQHQVFVGNFLINYIYFYNDELGIQLEDLQPLHANLMKNGIAILSEISEELHSSISSDEEGSYAVNVEKKSCQVAGQNLIDTYPSIGGSTKFHDSSYYFVSTEHIQPLEYKTAQMFAFSLLKAGFFGKGDGPLLIFKCKSDDSGNKWYFQECRLNSSSKFKMRSGQVLQKDEEAASKRFSYLMGDLKECTHLARFNVLEKMQMEREEESGQILIGEEFSKSSLFIDFLWTGPNGISAIETPPATAKILVRVCAAPGEKYSLCQSIYDELQCIQSFTDMDTKRNHSSNSSGNISFESSEDLSKMLGKFKSEVSDYVSYGLEEEQIIENGAKTENQSEQKDEDSENSIHFAENMSKEFKRQDYDFTDMLWLFVKNFSSMRELKEIFDDLINSIIHGQIQPAIGSTNNTQLGKFIRLLYTSVDRDSEDRMRAIERLSYLLRSEKDIINIVMEIGFEKLRKDYFNYFISRDLCTLNQLQSLAITGNRTLVNHQIDMQMLKNLHLCFELLIMIRWYLKMSIDYQRLLLKSAIEHLAKQNLQVTSFRQRSDTFKVENASRDPSGATSPLFHLSVMPFKKDATEIHNVCAGQTPVLYQKSFSHKVRDNVETVVMKSERRDAQDAHDEDTNDNLNQELDISLYTDKFADLPKRNLIETVER